MYFKGCIMLNSKKLFILALGITTASLRADIEQTPEETVPVIQEQVTEQNLAALENELQKQIEITETENVFDEKQNQSEENRSDMQDVIIAAEEQPLSTLQAIAEEEEEELDTTEEQLSLTKITSLSALLALAQQAQQSGSSIQINGQSYELEISDLNDHGTQSETNDFIDHASGK